MEREEKLFYPEVKFYGEELLLYLRCIRQEYDISFHPLYWIHRRLISFANCMYFRWTKYIGPEVKFYGEELLLYLRCIRQEYKVVYEPRLLIYHMVSLIPLKCSFLKILYLRS